jgi:tetratricopeptide (TPR) repeat protein
MKTTIVFFLIFTHTLLFSQVDTVLIKNYLTQIQEESLSNPDSALKICDEAMLYAKKHNIPETEASILGWYGYIYNQKGLIEKGLEYLLQGTTILEKHHFSKSDLASAYTNIGTINIQMKHFEEANEYFQKALIIRKEINDTEGIANSLYNIGINYSNLERYTESINYLNRGMQIVDSIGFEYGIAYFNLGLSSVYQKNNQHEEAKNSTQKAIIILRKLGDKRGLAHNFSNLGKIYLTLQNENLAKTYADSAYVLASEIGNPKVIKDAAFILSDIYKKQKNFTEALKFYEIHITMKDSVKNEETEKSVIRQQTQYEFEKTQLIKEQQQKEQQRLEQIARERRDNIQYSMIFLAILVIFGSILGLGFIKVSAKFAEGLIFFAFLIFFEFCLVLLDPIIDNWSSGEPIFKLLFNAILAGVIFPAHAFFENKLKKRIVKID